MGFMKALNCISCHVPMRLIDKKTVQNNFKKKFRQRRFKCPVCGYAETIYASGKRDVDYVEDIAKQDVKDYFKQQEENQ